MVATMRAALCLCLWLLACQVRSSNISVKMNKTMQNLLIHYKMLGNQSRFTGKNIFHKKLLEGKTEERMVYIGGVLEMYEQLIGHMLAEVPTPRPQTSVDQQRLTSVITPRVGTNAKPGVQDNAREGLKFIQSQIHALQKNYYKEQGTLLQELDSLKKVQVSDAAVQKKALLELLWLYDEASALANQKIQKRRRRRRRQARRVKNHPTA